MYVDSKATTTKATNRHGLSWNNTDDSPVASFSHLIRDGRKGDSRLTILPAITSSQLAQVSSLMRSFVGWLRGRYDQEVWFIDDYFNHQSFESELASLPGEYARPSGRLLLARYRGEPAGCVAMRPLEKQTCEMKRMFVHPDFQGKRIGRRLAETLIEEARKAGYRRIILDTGIRQVEAQRLYHRLGFEKIEPYYEIPEKVKSMLVFMALYL